LEKKYALILGSSSGFGQATALELAKRGFHIIGVHLDIGSAKKNTENQKKQLEELGVETMFFNVNAAEDSNREMIIQAIKDKFRTEDNSFIKCVLHSLAFGAIGPFLSQNPDQQINRKKMEMTLNVMSNSLLYWSQDLFHAGLLCENSRIFAMTSSGSTQAMVNYGALAVAKAALEAYIRQLAIEFAQYKITFNGILAGITDTPAARKIPDFDKMLNFARRQNPHKKNTQPIDVAKVIALLANDDSYWVTGSIIYVDGGENIANYFD
jgi:enoyl-[acyl-carrier protein] reductase III